MFAKGFHIYKLVWVFFIAGILGNFGEVIFLRLVRDQWMLGHSGLLHIPFSAVWGIGAVMITLLLGKLKEQRDLVVIFLGAVVCGICECLCSVLQQHMFGMQFTNHTDAFYSLGGRIDPLYCVVYGLLAMIWVKNLYPALSALIEKLPPGFGKVVTWIIMAALTADIFLTASALNRMQERRTGVEARAGFDTYLDMHYTDETLLKKFDGLRIVENVLPIEELLP